jgi:hypothetical protein
MRYLDKSLADQSRPRKKLHDKKGSRPDNDGTNTNPGQVSKS